MMVIDDDALLDLVRKDHRRHPHRHRQLPAVLTAQQRPMSTTPTTTTRCSTCCVRKTSSWRARAISTITLIGCWQLSGMTCVCMRVFICRFGTRYEEALLAVDESRMQRHTLAAVGAQFIEHLLQVSVLCVYAMVCDGVMLTSIR